jgi:sec-independent protein translocase protein TatA
MGLDNPLHIAFLLILLLLVFGAKRLPEMGRSLGSGLRGFKDTLSGEQTHHETHESVAAIPAQAPAGPAADDTAPTLQSEAAVAARAVGERVPAA